MASNDYIEYLYGEETENLFQVLYSKYYHPIYRYILSKNNHDHMIAEDLTQETFLKVYRNMDKIIDEASISKWLYVIAANICKDFWRSPKNKPLSAITQELDDENEPLISPSMPGDFVQTLMQQEVKKEIDAMVESLPSNYYHAIYLYDYEAYSYKEAAQIMGISVSAYTALLNRARAKLKKMIVSSTLGVDAKLLNEQEYEVLSSWLDFTHWQEDVHEQIKQIMRFHFNQMAAQYNDSEYFSYHELLFEIVKSKHALKKHHVVADFGMGAGVFLCHVSPYVASADGYDYSEVMIKMAQENFQSLRLTNVTCTQIDFMTIGSPMPIYDYVYCINVLHHTDNPEAMVKQIVSFLKPGGSLLIIDFLKHSYDTLVKENSDLWYGFDKQQMLRFLASANLRKTWFETISEPIKVALQGAEQIDVTHIVSGGTKRK